MRRIKDLVDDDWLIEQYESGKNTVDLGKELGFSPGVISHRLKQLNVQMRTGGQKTDADLSKIDSKEKLQAYFDAGYNVKQVIEEVGCSSSLINKRMKEFGLKFDVSASRMTKLVSIILKNEVVMNELYVEEGLSIYELSQCLGVDGKTVTKYLNQHGAKIKNDKLSYEVVQKLKNKEWLIAEHKAKSIRCISEELGVPRKKITGLLKKYGVQTETTAELSDEAKLILKDEHQMYLLYVTQNKTLKEIAEELNVSSYRVAKSLDAHAIALRKPGVHVNEDILVLLYDKKWIEKQYVIDRKTIKEIAEKLEVSPKLVKKHIMLHGFTLRSSAESKISEEAWKYLSNKEKLSKMYESLTMQKIAEKLNVDYSTVSEYMYKHNIQTRKGSESLLSSEIFTKLNNKKWLEEQYQTKTIEKLSEELNVSSKTIRKFLNDLGIEKIHVAEKLLGQEVFAKLNNKEWLEEQYKTKTMDKIGEELGVAGRTVYSYIDKHGIEIKGWITSQGEREVYEYVLSLGLEAEQSNRKLIHPFELDIYVPDRNVAIEYNGVYWHSEEFKGQKYHKQKYEACEKEGVQLIQIWEDQWRDKPEIVKYMLASKLKSNVAGKVGARKTKVKELGYKETKDFLDMYHIQGGCTGTLYLGLEWENEIVAVMVLKNTKDNVWRLERYATCLTVQGGFTKLLKYFQRSEDWSEVVTFADLCVSDGGLYANHGFKLDKVLPPDYMYVSVANNWSREHKFGYRLKRFRTDPELYWDESLSESQLAKINDLYRVWDAGKQRWVIQNPDISFT